MAFLLSLFSLVILDLVGLAFMNWLQPSGGENYCRVPDSILGFRSLSPLSAQGAGVGSQGCHQACGAREFAAADPRGGARQGTWGMASLSG